MNGPLRNIKEQRGVFVPLLAVIALPVFIFVALLGYRPLYYRMIRDTLEQNADEAAALLANQALFPGEVAERLATLVNSNFFDPDGLMWIESVRLVMPTMPDTATVRFAEYSCPPAPLAPGPGNAMVIWNWFANLDITPCSLDSGADCQFIGDTCSENARAASLPAPQLIEQFPQSLFDRAAHAGSAVSLVITVRPANLFFYSIHPVVKDITVRVSYTSEVKGYSHGNVYTGQAERAEVVMIVGPQAKVDDNFAISPQFEVTPSDYDTIFEDPSRGNSDWYNPLNSLDTFTHSTSPRPVANSLWWAGTAIELPGFSAPTTAAELRRLRIKCSNPGVIARQAVTGMLANMFARNGTTRKSMSVYYARAQHRPRRASYGGIFADTTLSHQTLPDLLNPPVTIVRWGTDITDTTLVHPTESFWLGASNDPEYQIPIAFGGGTAPSAIQGLGSYDTTNATSYPDQVNGLRRRGWIQPLRRIAPANTLWEEENISSPLRASALEMYQYIVALQSAACDHAYVDYSGIGAANTMYFDQTHVVRKLRSKSIIPNYYDPVTSTAFEGLEYEYSKGTLVNNDRDNEPRFARNGRNLSDWVQPCFNAALPSANPEAPACPNPGDSGRRLDEILFTLGTSEMCPLRRDWQAAGTSSLGSFCQSGGPVDPNNDLSPDIIAALYAAVRQLRNGSPAYDWSSQGVGGAYPVPGIFEPLAPGGLFPLNESPSFTPVVPGAIDPIIYRPPAYHPISANDVPPSCSPTNPSPDPCPNVLNMSGPIILVTHQLPKGDVGPPLTNEARQLKAMIDELNSLGRPVFWLYFPLHAGQASAAKAVLGAILDVDSTRNRLFIANPASAVPSLPDTPAGLATYYHNFLSDLTAGSPITQNAAGMAWQVYTHAMSYETKL